MGLDEVERVKSGVMIKAWKTNRFSISTCLGNLMVTTPASCANMVVFLTLRLMSPASRFRRLAGGDRGADDVRVDESMFSSG